MQLRWRRRTHTVTSAHTFWWLVHTSVLACRHLGPTSWTAIFTAMVMSGESGCSAAGDGLVEAWPKVVLLRMAGASCWVRPPAGGTTRACHMLAGSWQASRSTTMAVSSPGQPLFSMGPQLERPLCMFQSKDEVATQQMPTHLGPHLGQ